ncbi:MAG TPA: glutamate formimidoyltransferase [Terriglobales bacterium]|nr:glutamate formimidoyltransferase [Terriglobales bacterium]
MFLGEHLWKSFASRLAWRQSPKITPAVMVSSSGMRSLIECVPNFSEGRDKSKVEAIIAAMQVDGAYLLAHEMDADHNRSVVTMAGHPEAIQEAAIRGVGKAAELIDLNSHRGVHPRLGAADVVPFIPIEGATLEDCVAIAHHVGAEIWKRYKVPVYLYEAAATSPERRNLENVRRGGFEVVRDEIASLAARKPDFGDLKLHPTAGAAIVGARKFLIAYNIFLSTTEVEVARKVAMTVRTSSGGLPCVKASGFLVRGQAQVSMNLTDFETTSMEQVFAAVQSEAAKHGADVASSEIIGLVPKKALRHVTPRSLRIENFDEERILENRLAAAMSLPG